MRNAAIEVWEYGDPENHDLRAALAKYHNVKPDNIVVGEGIDGLLGYLARMVISEGTPVVTSRGAYPTFNYHVTGFGGRLEFVPYREDREDPEALLAHARETKSPLIYIANPDNPMGTWNSAATIQEMMDGVPEGAILCLDEAYADFAPAQALPPIDTSNPRVIRFRTFSKAYGMAGARVGYGIAQEDLALAFNKIRNHFGVNRIAQVGAIAALEDQDYLDDVRRKVEEALERTARIATANGLKPLPSATNFVAIDCGRDGAYAKSLLDALVERGIFVRMPFVEPQNRCIRVSAGRPHELDAFAEALPDALRELS